MLKYAEKVFEWIREHTVVVLAGLGAAILAILSMSRDWNRVQGRQLMDEMEQLAVQKKRLDEVRKEVEGTLQKNSIDQRILKEETEMIDKKIEEIRDEVSQLKIPAIVDRFNQLYN